MTSEEAKEWLSPETSPMKIHMSELNGENPMDYINQAIKVATTALDKQINQKPTVCNHGEKTNYCPNCGQKLNWSDKE